MKPLITMIVPAYNQPNMLRKQAETWKGYSRETAGAFRFVVVDDCSPEPAVSAIEELACFQGFSLYRIDEDVPWNRGMARNLGTHVAETDWILHVDTDHVLPAESAAALAKKFEHATPTKMWYRFQRCRVGAADDTRKKDKLPPGATFGEIHPHIDSYLCTPKAYWAAGGYNEDFSGVLGGGSPFLKEMERVNGEPAVLSIPLHVHTRDSVPDSSEHTLSRDPAAFKKRKQEIMAKRGTLRGHDPLRLPWHKVF